MPTIGLTQASTAWTQSRSPLWMTATQPSESAAASSQGMREQEAAKWNQALWVSEWGKGMSLKCLLAQHTDFQMIKYPFYKNRGSWPIKRKNLLSKLARMISSNVFKSIRNFDHVFSNQLLIPTNIPLYENVKVSLKLPLSTCSTLLCTSLEASLRESWLTGWDTQWPHVIKYLLGIKYISATPRS